MLKTRNHILTILNHHLMQIFNHNFFHLAKSKLINHAIQSESLLIGNLEIKVVDNLVINDESTF